MSDSERTLLLPVDDSSSEADSHVEKHFASM